MTDIFRYELYLCFWSSSRTGILYTRRGFGSVLGALLEEEEKLVEHLNTVKIFYKKCNFTDLFEISISLLKTFSTSLLSILHIFHQMPITKIIFSLLKFNLKHTRSILTPMKSTFTELHSTIHTNFKNASSKPNNIYATVLKTVIPTLFPISSHYPTSSSIKAHTH